MLNLGMLKSNTGVSLISAGALIIVGIFLTGTGAFLTVGDSFIGPRALIIVGISSTRPGAFITAGVWSWNTNNAEIFNIEI